MTALARVPSAPASSRGMARADVVHTVRFVASKVAGLALVLLIVSALTFAVFVLLPADPAQLSCGRPCTPQRLEAARGYMGLDRSAWNQYADFLRGIVAGRTFGAGPTAITCDAPCLGYSFRLNESVTTLIVSRLPVTFSIAIGAAVLWFVGGVAAGVVAAIRRGTLTDRFVILGAVTGVSAPGYLVGLLGILLFGFTLDVVRCPGTSRSPRARSAGPGTSCSRGPCWHSCRPPCTRG